MEEFQHEPEGRTPVLTVGECIEVMNNAVERLGRIRVRGEISGAGLRGHAYFSLRDQDYTVECILWKYLMPKFSHLLEEGFEVLITGRPNVWKTGRLRIIADSVEPVGEGALLREFEMLKKRLEERGSFDPSRKRPIPEYVRKIGLITSETGAAVTDFLQNVGEHGFQIFLYDVRVEGDYAQDALVSAMRWMNKHRPDLDVLVLIRGGGSLESLKAYNSEKVADAILLSRLPVISGIGHERDVTIADYVADRSFSTPTAAASFLRTQREELSRDVDDAAERLGQGTQELLESKREETEKLKGEMEAALARVAEHQRFRIARSAEALQGSLRAVFESFSRLEASFRDALYAYEAAVENAAHRVALAERTLASWNPENVLQRGYSIVSSKDGRVIRESAEVKIGERIRVRLWKGQLGSRVEEKE